MIVIDPALIDEAHELLNRARLIAEAPAAQSTEIGHGHPDSQMPPGLQFSKAGALYRRGISTLQACGVRISAAETSDSDEEMRAAIAWCTNEIDRLQHGSKGVAETPAEFEARIVRVYEGVSAPEVARAERTYVRRVRDARLKHGRSARFGHKQTGEGHPPPHQPQ